MAVVPLDVLVGAIPTLPVNLARAQHAYLCERAERWLESIGCGVTFSELVTVNNSGEVPDAIGWRWGASVLVECKTSRGDFLADAKKSFRKNPATGMGDWRLFLCPPGLIKPEELPTGWGLLYAHPKKIERVKCFKSNGGMHPTPFAANKAAEQAMLLSALRRLKLRGRLHEIYEPGPKDPP